MDAQQLHDYIIKPTLEHMDSLGGNYNTKEARFLLLCTAAIESNCGDKIVQDGIECGKGGLGMFQMETITHNDTWLNCDALKSGEFASLISRLRDRRQVKHEWEQLLASPMYACSMSRLKYAMDKEALPEIPSTGVKGLIATDAYYFWKQYKRIYNTNLGDATFDRWQQALNDNRIFDVDLGE